MLHTDETQAVSETQTVPDRPRKGFRRYQPDAEIVAPFFLPYVVGFSTTTAWRLRRRGLFPAPIRLSAGRVGWRRRDLEEWLAERAAAASK
jgi:prophage regulatory protein